MENNIKSKMINATKWSFITEIVARIVTPIINMILARILAPEAFGVLTTIIMIISFAEVFVEAGFQKYLIQHQFLNESEERQYMSVAFWANLLFSLFIWIMLVIFNKELACLVGNEGLGHLISITGVTIPLFGIIGIQNCKIKKELEFQKLFYVRIISALVPLVITLPLALAGFDYWALIIGNIIGVIIRSVILVIIGKFIPKLYFNWHHLKRMLSYGMWTLLDGIALWGTNWLDAFLISRFMTGYYLGLYKNASNTVNSLFTIVTAAVIPVLFSSLSKLQNDSKMFNNMFLSAQKVMTIFLLPIGVGLFFYRELVTLILFGKTWIEAADIVGIISISTALRTIFISFYGDAYRAKGKFFIPLILQIVELTLLIPVCILAVKKGFWLLVYARAFLKLDIIIPEIIIIWKICGITIKDTFINLQAPIIGTIIMSLVILILKNFSASTTWEFISIVIAMFVYGGSLLIFEDIRRNVFIFVRKKYLKLKNRLE